MTTPIDHESVEKLEKRLRSLTNWPEAVTYQAAEALAALRASLDEAEAENKRLRDGLVELRDDPILHKKTAYMRRRAAVILKENPND